MKSFALKATLFAMLATVSLPLMAQDEDEDAPKGKPNVYMDYFQRPSSVPFTWAEDLRNKIIEGIYATERIEITDVDSNSALKVEENRRENENLTISDDPDRLAAMTQEGANFLITGLITNMEAVKKVGESSTTYEGKVTFTLKVIDPKSGKLVASKNYNVSTGGLLDTDTYLKSASTDTEAITNTNTKAVKKMKQFVDEVFPVTGKVLEVDEKDGRKAKTVYIGVGSEQGITKDVKFEACTVTTVAGRPTRKKIGELKVTEVAGDDISLCKVENGGEEILKALNAGEKVIAIIKAKK